MTRLAAPAPSAPRLPLALGVVGLACLAVITLTYPGSTRMFAWPWSLAYAGALLAPVLALLARTFDPIRPLALPSLAWTRPALAAATTVLASALASPWSGPSLLWSAPLLAAVALFFVLFDALRSGLLRPARLDLVVGLAFAATLLTSLFLWLPTTAGRSLASIAAARNPFPLGHASYTAGAALLGLPWLCTLALRARGRTRLAWSLAAALSLVVLVSSGSRAAIPALAALGFVALLLSPLPRPRKLLLALALPLAALLVAVANPRTRAMFTRADPAAAPNISNVQRSAMLTAALRMGQDRPLFGYGPGTTPLAYPRYRAGLDGGAENVLQLHSTPAQLWAELGAAGLACALLAALVTLRAAYRRTAHPTAIAALAAYAVFALADYQLDVPFFAFALALGFALVADPTSTPTAPPTRRAALAIGVTTLLLLALIATFGRPDPAPELNTRALTLAHSGTPAATTQAIALLRESLALNPDQEIAHFNLGWLLLISDPAAAERHFTEALHLVPDKGGVYFGLGLARLNQNHPAPAARAFALECLNDPAFLFSPWWRDPSLAALRPRTSAEFSELCTVAARSLRKSPNATYAATLLPGLAALAPQLGTVPTGPEHSYRRERRGYPVLMRNLDLPTPVDLYDVRELSVAPSSASLPPKSWLPSPLLLELLDAPMSH